VADEEESTGTGLYKALTIGSLACGLPALLIPLLAVVILLGVIVGTGGTDNAGAANPNGSPTVVPDVLWQIFTMAGSKHETSPYLIAAIYGYGEHCARQGSGNSCPEPGWPTEITQTAASPVGASGPFQFMPSTWPGYAEDCDGNGTKDINNLYDSACAASSYLASGGARGVYNANPPCGNSGSYVGVCRAIYSYNHADWYVARVYDGYNTLLASGSSGNGTPASNPASATTAQIITWINNGSIKLGNPVIKQEIQNVLKQNTLDLIAAIHNAGYHFQINAAGPQSHPTHCPGQSLHCVGLAIDIEKSNVSGTGSVYKLQKWLFDNQNTLKIDELFGPDPDRCGSGCLSGGKPSGDFDNGLSLHIGVFP
jgi:hypothetical protein